MGIVLRNLFWLSDEQWKRIERHLPTDVRGVKRVDDRRVISGIVHVLKSGWQATAMPVYCLEPVELADDHN
jgi:transposase